MTKKNKIISNERKTTIQLLLGVIMAVFGVLLIIASFCVPPMGIIDASVLAAIGEVFTFSGSLIGIDYHYRVKDNEIRLKHREDEDNGEENIQ